VGGSALTYSATGLQPLTTYGFAVQATDASGIVTGNGPIASFTAQTPSAALVAPAIDHTVGTTLASASSFLYSGSDPVQQGLTASIDPQRVAVLRGTVTDVNGNALLGVAVTITNQLGRRFQ